MHILLLYFLATPALAPIRGSGAEDVSPATFHPHDVATRQTSERPTDGGLWSFDPSDVVTHFDEPSGGFRIHYSIDGPNQTLLADADDSGVPDMVELVGATAAVALELFTEQLGFRPPPTEADLNLGPLGGSDAYDIYLVDFGGGADGAFGTDACLSSPRHCTGYLVIENDFVGYSYPSLNAAVDTLVSHELFHAVTAAYDAAVPVWISEGTAVCRAPVRSRLRGFCPALQRLSRRHRAYAVSTSGRAGPGFCLRCWPVVGLCYHPQRGRACPCVV